MEALRQSTDPPESEQPRGKPVQKPDDTAEATARVHAVDGATRPIAREVGCGRIMLQHCISAGCDVRPGEPAWVPLGLWVAPARWRQCRPSAQDLVRERIPVSLRRLVRMVASFVWKFAAEAGATL